MSTLNISFLRRNREKYHYFLIEQKHLFKSSVFTDIVDTEQIV